jgi:hypothetical protein
MHSGVKFSVRESLGVVSFYLIETRFALSVNDHSRQLKKKKKEKRKMRKKEREKENNWKKKKEDEEKEGKQEKQ